MNRAPVNTPASRAPIDLGRAALPAVMLLLLLVPPGNAVAQPCGGSYEAVQLYVERTEEILQLAAETVRDSESARARLVLEGAVQRHRNSVDWLERDRPRLACANSQEARRAAQHAAKLARDELGVEERAQIKLEHLREMRDQILERAEEAQNERAVRFVQEAERQVHRAVEQHSQHNYEITMHLLESAEALLKRAARLLFEGGGVDRLERELSRTGELIQRIGDRPDANADPAAVDLLRRAEEILNQARDAFTQRQPLRAFRLANRARLLAGQAAAMTGGGPSTEAVQAQIGRWDERFAAVSDRVREARSEAAGLLLDRAREYRRRAEDRLRAADREDALREIKMAHDLLNEADELVR